MAPAEPGRRPMPTEAAAEMPRVARSPLAQNDARGPQTVVLKRPPSLVYQPRLAQAFGELIGIRGISKR